LHWRVIGLLAWLTFFFNIDRLSAVTGQSLVIQNLAVSVIGVSAAILPLLPIVQERSLLTQSSLIALLYVGVSALNGPFWASSMAAWNMLAGFVLLLVTVVLSHRVAQGFLEFRSAVETVTLAMPNGNKRLRNLEDTREMVDVEMVRSRRFERPLSLVMIQADTSSINMQMHRIVQEVQRGMMQRYVLATMAHVLSRTLRRTDIVVEDAQPGRLLLVAPETNDAEATQMGSRVARLIQERLGIGASYGVAAFPQQALTFEDLRNVAEADLHSETSAVNGDLSNELLEFNPRTNVPAPEKEHVRA
jgi:predicted signal transduction protein with EAL and GGDEF domain